ncbi:MAG TPA: response regulator [Puia sp.]|jgi:CheY-like chemotaxis protein
MKRLINILLIEDDHLDQLEVQRIMDKRSILYKLKIAKNGEEGLQMLRENSSPVFEGPPDIIILDLNMPKMNGFEFLQNLKPEEVKNIKIFVLTTSEEKEDKLLSKHLGVSGFITKPLKLESPSSLDAFNLMINLMNMQN